LAFRDGNDRRWSRDRYAADLAGGSPNTVSTTDEFDRDAHFTRSDDLAKERFT
jgi:hypothetical protein